MLGLKELLVVNEMDAVGYQQEVFDDVREKVAALLDSFGYHGVTFIPGSAMGGQHLPQIGKDALV